MPKPEISNAFASAGQSQKIHYLTKRVEELEAEINQLRAIETNSEEKLALEERIQELITELAKKQEVQEIPINLIDRNPHQPRQTFANDSIQGMAELLKQQGQHTPIILIPLSNGRYLLFDGERRWRAATKLGWTKLKAVLTLAGTETDNIELHRQALSTTLHREDLNALDLAESLIKQIIYDYPELKEQRDAIPRFLNSAMSRLERSRKNLELADIRLASKQEQDLWIREAQFKNSEEDKIFEVILALQLNPTSIDTNVFPLLKLPKDLKTAIREQGLESSKAKELSKVSDVQLKIDESEALSIRSNLTQKVIQEKLSLSQTKLLVKEVVQKYKSSEPTVKPITKIVKSIQAIKLDEIQHNQLEEIKEALQIKLNEIEKRLASNN